MFHINDNFAQAEQKFVKKTCHHNNKVLKFSNDAELQGLEGRTHFENWIKYDLNIFLDKNFIPFEEAVLSNCSEGLMAQENDPRILVSYIKDTQVPDSIKLFDHIIEKAVSVLSTGGKVAVSCVGGHGRTGMALAIINQRMRPTKSKTPVEDLRAIYCSQAVENMDQKEFVHDYLGLEAPKEDELRETRGAREIVTMLKAPGLTPWEAKNLWDEGDKFFDKLSRSEILLMDENQTKFWKDFFKLGDDIWAKWNEATRSGINHHQSGQQNKHKK